jgi:hypothetical protein
LILKPIVIKIGPLMKAKLVKSTVVALALAAMPTAAYAVSVSSNDGSGTQYRTVSYSNGAKVSGTLRSTSGKKVGYNGKVAVSLCSDIDVGRYSETTTSVTAVTRGGTISALILPPCGFQGVESRVCTVRTLFPDACGSDSATY